MDESLSARVEELIQSHQGSELLSTTGTEATIAELALRSEGLTRVVREIAREVEKLAASQEA